MHKECSDKKVEVASIALEDKITEHANINKAISNHYELLTRVMSTWLLKLGNRITEVTIL